MNLLFKTMNHFIKDFSTSKYINFNLTTQVTNLINIYDKLRFL